MSYPILEYDSTREALIEPHQVIKPHDVPEYCVICFFREVLDKVVAEQNAEIIAVNHCEDGPHPLYEIKHQGKRLAFFHPGVGAPMAAALLEEVIARGCRKFIACGSCGVLDKEIAVGRLIIISAAVRDEGTSYHYLPPSREVLADESGVKALETTLSSRGIPYLIGKTWTTDAIYRETAGRISRRRAEGCLAVEMEAAALTAVAQFRGVVFGQVLYGGDDLSGNEWDDRGWRSRADIRESLFWLCVDACITL